MIPETLSSEEERLEYRKLKRRERIKRRQTENKQYEPRHYSRHDESFARRLAAGFRIGGGE